MDRGGWKRWAEFWVNRSFSRSYTITITGSDVPDKGASSGQIAVQIRGNFSSENYGFSVVPWYQVFETSRVNNIPPLSGGINCATTCILFQFLFIFLRLDKTLNLFFFFFFHFVRRSGQKQKEKKKRKQQIDQGEQRGNFFRRRIHTLRQSHPSISHPTVISNGGNRLSRWNGRKHIRARTNPFPRILCTLSRQARPTRLEH